MALRLRGNDTSTPIATSATPSTDLKRRRFLLSLGASGATAAAAGLTVAQTSAPAEQAAEATDGGTAAYRETEHVRDYYRSAKL